MSEQINEASNVNSIKEMQRSVQVILSNEKTYLILTATHKDRSKNKIHKISCRAGIPIGGYVYDAQTDSYHIDCAEHIHLGYVSASFVASIKDIQHWKIRIPMAENVIKKYLSQLQKKELRSFKNLFKSDEYEIQFIQMIDPN